LSGVFIIGVEAGGPPVMIFGWIGVCVVTLFIALAMAEMCARWPVSGGQYSWVAMLAPPKVSRQLSYITGWFMLVGSYCDSWMIGLQKLIHVAQVFWRWAQ